MNRIRFLVLLLLTGLWLTSASQGRAAPPLQTAEIRITDGAFDPPVLTVQEGTVVTWTNVSATTHTLATPDNRWSPVQVPAGTSYARVFEEVGSHDYYSVEGGSPDGSGMAGTIIVEPGSDDPTVVVVTTDSDPEAGLIEVSDQLSDGLFVTVDRVVAPEAAFVVIHPNDTQGNPLLDQRLGYSPVAAGLNTQIPVRLDAPLLTGGLLHATLHLDTDTMGLYEYPGADVPVTEGGEIVSAAFFVTLAGNGGAGGPADLPETGGPGLPTEFFALFLMWGAIFAAWGILLHVSEGLFQR